MEDIAKVVDAGEEQKKQSKLKKEKTEQEYWDAFLMELNIRRKPSAGFGTAKSIEYAQEIFLHQFWGKLNDNFRSTDEVEKDVLYYVFSNIITRDKISPRTFYENYIKDRHKDYKLFTYGTSLQRLDLVKKFLTETIYADEINKNLCGSIFRKDGGVIMKYAPEIVGSPSIKDCIQRAAYHCLEKTSGNVIFMDDFDLIGNKSGVVNDLIKENYDNIKGTTVWVKKDLFDDKTNSFTAQQDILMTYNAIVRKYLLSSNTLFEPENISKKDFEFRTNKLRNALDLIEKRLTDKTKENISYKDCKEIEEKFYANKDVIFDSLGLRDFDWKLSKAINKSEENKNLFKTEQDAVEKFKKMVKTLSKNLKSTKSSTEKKADFFLITTMQPCTFFDLATKFSSGNLCSEDEAEEIEEIKSKLVKKDMFGEAARQKVVHFEKDRSLRQYKGMKVAKGGKPVIDLSDENYDAFVERIDRFIEDNNLPNTELCHSALADVFIFCQKNAEEVKAKA